jgi:hypothetical protein
MTIDEPVTLYQMLSTGATYRQLDYWTRACNYLHASSPGSGHARVWTEREYRVAALMVRLLRAGIELGVAAKVARHAVESNTVGTTTPEGIAITWGPL